MEQDQTQLLIDTLKTLESPRDIVTAISDLSRVTGGEVMVFLQTTTKYPKIADLWFNPKAMQQELDSDPDGNIHAKLFNDIYENRLRVSNVLPLQVDWKQDNAFNKAVAEFGTKVGYKRDNYTYAICLTKNVS